MVSELNPKSPRSCLADLLSSKSRRASSACAKRSYARCPLLWPGPRYICTVCEGYMPSLRVCVLMHGTLASDGVVLKSLTDIHSARYCELGVGFPRARIALPTDCNALHPSCLEGPRRHGSLQCRNAQGPANLANSSMESPGLHTEARTHIILTGKTSYSGVETQCQLRLAPPSIGTAPYI